MRITKYRHNRPTDGPCKKAMEQAPVLVPGLRTDPPLDGKPRQELDDHRGRDLFEVTRMQGEPGDVPRLGADGCLGVLGFEAREEIAAEGLAEASDVGLRTLESLVGQEVLRESGQQRGDVALRGDPQAGGGRIMLMLADHGLGDAIVVGAQAEGAAPAA